MSSHVCLSLPRCLFFVGWPSETTPTNPATYPANLNPLYLVILIILGEQYKLCHSSRWSLLHFTFASLLSPNIRFRILFSNTLSLGSSRDVRDRVPQSYSKIDCFLYILIFKFLEIRRKKQKSLY